MEGQGLLVHDIQVQRKAGAAGGEEEAQFPRVLMQQGHHPPSSAQRGGREQETAGRARERLGTLKIQLPQQENGDTRDAAHSTAPRPRTEAEREDLAQWNIPLPQAKERPWRRDTQRKGERVSRGECEGRKDPAPMRDRQKIKERLGPEAQAREVPGPTSLRQSYVRLQLHSSPGHESAEGPPVQGDER